MVLDFTVPGRALVRTPVAPMYAEPHVTSIQISQRLCGHEVELMAEQDDWFRARGIDLYEGWIHRGFLSPTPAEGARGSRQVPRISLGCVTSLPDGGTRAMPLGARLSPAETLKFGEIVAETELRTRFPRATIPIAKSAQQYFEGTPYLWGGITPWGADCSGFAQSIFGLHGVELPRDAWQQMETGEDAGALDKLRAGDLAFFTDREDLRATHVAIALGSRRLAHLALGRGGFAIENLGDKRDQYAARLRERFLRARRVL